MKRQIFLLLLFSLLTVSACSATVNLGTAGNFGLLAGSTITNTGSSVIYGDVGVSPGSAVTGFYPDGIVNGNLYLAPNAITQQAQTDLTTAYIAAADPLLPRTTLTGQDLGGMTLDPGVYFFSTEAMLTGTLMLHGNGDPNAQWIFQIGSTLKTGTDFLVLLDNATKCQVFWQVGSSATIGTAAPPVLNSTFVGTIMADQSITLNGGILNGRALASVGAVTISRSETVNAGPCRVPAAVPEASTLIGFGSALALTGPGLLGWLRRRRA